MTTPRNNSLGRRYVRLVQSLPIVCPPIAPSVVGAVTIGLTTALGQQWSALAVAAVLIALAPQWESCIFGLMDLMTCIAVSIVGFVGLWDLVAG